MVDRFKIWLSSLGNYTRIRAKVEDLGNQFWLRPALIVLACVGLAILATWYDRLTAAANDPDSSSLGYSGGGEGARSLLSAVASSSIGVAGTIFSITIAALSLASGQMGPRLLRNFVRDIRNQIALGIFLGTFAYALMVLRTVRTVDEGSFVPHVGVTGAMALALICIGTLVWYVHHIAASINVETVVDAVHADLIDAIRDKTLSEAALLPPAALPGGEAISASGSGVLQAVDGAKLADWAAAHGVTIRMRVRPGAFVPFGAPVAEVSAAVDGARAVFDEAMTFGKRQAALQDLEYPVRQLNEIAVRALSPGINDPFTAGSVLDRFGDALCRIVHRHLPRGAIERAGRVVVTLDVVDYDGLCDGMFHTIRQNGSGSAYVLIRSLEVLARVAEVERLTDRRAALRRHADLAVAAAREGVGDAAGLQDCEARHRAFSAASQGGEA